MKRSKFRITIILLALTLLLTGLQTLSVLASADQNAGNIAVTDDNTYRTAGDQKIVRVGYYHSDNFQEGTSDFSEKSGYAYDYMQNVAYYAGWKYEYIYGDWASLYDALVCGEIDVLAGINYTPERKDLVLFPDLTMGKEHYYLYIREDDDSIHSGDFSSYNGKSFAIYRNNTLTEYLEDWLEMHNIQANLVEYDTYTEAENDFIRGKVDCMIGSENNAAPKSSQKTTDLIREKDYYLGVSRFRPDLLTDLNEAQKDISTFNSSLTDELYDQYFSNSVTNNQLSKEEQDWLDKHKKISVGYLINYLPYSDFDDTKDGYATGVMVEVLPQIMEHLGKTDMEFEYVPFEDSASMISALQNKSVDCIFPCSTDKWSAEENEIFCSEPVITASMVLVYKDAYTDRTKSSIALNQNNAMQISYVKNHFPDAALVYKSSIEECLQAVVKGEANCTVLNGLRANAILNDGRFSPLMTLQLENTDGRCFAVSADNRALLKLLNRGLQMLGSNYALDISYNYVDGLYSYSVIDFLQDNILIILAAIILVVFLVVSIITGLYHKKNLAEKQAKQALKKAEEANKAKTTFLFNMSHDIRTPMNAIVGFSNLLERDIDNPRKVREYITKIKDASDFMLALINNVLEMARIESGDVRLREDCWNAEAFNDTLFSVFGMQMQEKGLQFRHAVDVDHRYVICDSTKVCEIYLNLLSNAYKYTPRGGEVSLYLKEIPSMRPGYAMYQTTIRDTGIGMSKDYMQHIFKEFSREHNTTESKIQGTGLGMAIVKHYVDLMEGTIQVKSDPGRGTEFIVNLPLRIATEQDKVEMRLAARNKSRDRFQGKRVLLAEDNDLNAEIAIELLMDAGFEVERVEDGQQCYDRLVEKPINYYDLILMDIQMPNLNGYDATRKIRGMHDSLRSMIPIIAMTANAFEEDKRNAVSAGMNGHISKPINVDDMLSTLADITAYQSQIVNTLYELSEAELMYNENDGYIVDENDGFVPDED